MILTGDVYPTTPGSSPGVHEVVMKSDAHSLPAQELLVEAGVPVMSADILGHYALIIDPPELWEVVEAIPNLLLTPPTEGL